MPEQKDKEKIIIIGSGPAGYTAAIYAARAGLSPLMITGTLEGGQITETQELGNWPGEPEPITGFDLMDKMKKQAAGYGVRFQNDTVLAIARHDGAISLQCEKGTAEAEAVIIATGASPRRLSINGEAEFWGQGVSSCATCDGFFYRKKRKFLNDTHLVHFEWHLVLCLVKFYCHNDLFLFLFFTVQSPHG